MNEDTMIVVVILISVFAVIVTVLNTFWQRTQRRLCPYCGYVSIKSGKDIFFRCTMCNTVN